MLELRQGKGNFLGDYSRVCGNLGPGKVDTEGQRLPLRLIKMVESYGISISSLIADNSVVYEIFQMKIHILYHDGKKLKVFFFSSTLPTLSVDRWRLMHGASFVTCVSDQVSPTEVIFIGPRFFKI